MSAIIESDMIYGSILLYFASFLGAVGGIGGGVLNLPVLIVVFKYSVSKSVFLSICAVVGSTGSTHRIMLYSIEHN